MSNMLFFHILEIGRKAVNSRIAMRVASRSKDEEFDTARADLYCNTSKVR
jgi:hypothetical protein